MLSRKAIFASLALLVFTSACAVSGRGHSVDDDDGDDDSSLTTTGSGGATAGTGTGAAAADSGSGGAQSSTGVLAGSTGSGTSTSGTTGSTSSGSTSSGGACTPTNLVFNDTVCGGCAESQCCPELGTCDGSLDCIDFVTCLGDCVDQTCVDSCIAIYPSGSNQYISLDTCLNDYCPIECPAG